MMTDPISALILSELPLACATCMGDAGSLTNKAAGYAIVFMLVMLAIVLGSLIRFMCYLSKRENTAGQQHPVPVRISNDPN